MNKIFLIFILLFPLPLFAEWTFVTKNASGESFYVDFDRIKKHNGVVYHWALYDYLEQKSSGVFSSKLYIKVECKLVRRKVLRDVHYTGQMGEGTIRHSSNIPDKEWRYTSPESVDEKITEKVCSH